MNLELKTIIDTYEFDALKSEFETAQTVENVYIGVLGEFSSGKSSLLNSILHKKILPAMDKPTTKSITYIKSDNDQESEVEYFEILKDDSEERISLIEFQDIAKGNRAGESLVSVKSNDFLNKGYIFIDTPGVSSYDQMDIDITYGLLPKLDGVLVCIDCNTGTLNSSLQNFLQRPEINLIKDKILFALTKSDNKTTESINKIIDGFKIDILKYLNISDIDKRIISFTANDIFDKQDNNSNEKLLNLFDVSINSRRNHMISQRLKLQEANLKNKVIDALKDLKTKLSYDDSQFKVERIKLEDDIETLNLQKNNIKKKLTKFKDSLFDEIKSIGDNCITCINDECSKVTPDQEILSTYYYQYTSDINEVIINSVVRNFKEYNIVEPKKINSEFGKLTMNINSILKSKETITGLANLAVIAAAVVVAAPAIAATATATAAGTAAAGAASTATVVGAEIASTVVTTVAVKTSTKAALTKIAIEGGKKFITEQGQQIVKEVIDPNSKSTAGNVMDTIKQYNPLEHIGAYFSKVKIQSKTTLEIKAIGEKIINNTINTIGDQIDLLFNEIEDKVKINENNLSVAFGNLKKGKNEVEKTKQNIQNEIFKLS